MRKVTSVAYQYRFALCHAALYITYRPPIVWTQLTRLYKCKYDMSDHQQDQINFYRTGDILHSSDMLNSFYGV